jgi:hypothetical protein
MYSLPNNNWSIFTFRAIINLEMDAFGETENCILSALILALFDF